jgi:cyclopropane fatty-acyl-phospholipid synthase-like methyltransferase
LRAWIYDKAIVNLTAGWYASVLGRLPYGARLLDVGIGTGGALARNADLLMSKGVCVVGVDIDVDYIVRAKKAVTDAGLDDRVDVRFESITDHTDGPYDAIYFSASFMLMPDPPSVLRHVTPLLTDDGQIFFTQTFQDRPSRFMEKAKPLLKKVTTINFGTVTYEDDFRETVAAGGVELLEIETLATHGSRSYRMAVGRPLG